MLAQVISSFFLFSGCGKDEEVVVDENVMRTFYADRETPGESISEDRAAQAEILAAEEASRKPQRVSLKEEELQEWKEALESSYGLLLSSYDSPEEIDWNEVCYDGIPGQEEQITDAEMETLAEVIHMDEIYTGVTRISNENMEGYVIEITGTDYKDATRPLSWIYLEQYDAWYFLHGDTNYMAFDVVEGERDGNRITLHCRPEQPLFGEVYLDYELVIRGSTESWHVVSNHLLWQESEDLLDFYVTDRLGEKESELAIYRDASGVVYPVVFEGDHFVNALYYPNDENSPSRVRFSVLDIAVDDFDLDGRNDILLCSRYDGQARVNLYRQSTDSSGDVFYMMDFDTESLMGPYVVDQSSITADKVRRILLGNAKNGQFADYKEGYRAVAKLYGLYQDMAVYALIDFDGDATPELLTGIQDYQFSMYTFRDGRVYRVIDNWAYGAAGIEAYEYLPGENLIRNVRSDIEGKQTFVTWMSVGEDGIVRTLQTIEVINFDDRNGDGFPDENEPFLRTGAIYLLNGEEITHERYEEMTAGDYENLNGTIGYGALTSLLR